MPTSHNDAIRNPRMRKSSYTLLYYIGAVLLFLSCDSRTTYSHYQHVNVTGWEKNDAIVYEIPPAPQDGVYRGDCRHTYRTLLPVHGTILDSRPDSIPLHEKL